MEMKMLPSNTYYNFNGPSLNHTFGQLAVHHPSVHLNSSIDNGQTDHHSIDDNLQHNQLYELHHTQPINTTQNNYNQSNLDNPNEEIISLFKLKNFLNQPKKPTSMQNMFSNGQELSSTSLQLLSSSSNENGINLVNHEPTHSSPLQTTSAPFYNNNLAPSAIGTSAIVSAPMLLSQSNSDQFSIDSQRNATNTSTINNQLINFEPPNLFNRSNQTQSTQQRAASTEQQLKANRLVSSTKDVPLRKFTCKYCGQIFQAKSEMQVHYTGHHRESKPFKCSFEGCKKRFQKTNYLKQHYRIHTNETPFACDMCDRKFKQQSHLKQHIRTHTGAKPYRCKYDNCDKSFSQESNLRSHMRSHESARPFKCNSCHKTYDVEQDLFNHIPSHRNTKHTKVHICDFCGKSYAVELYLSKHRTQKHGDRVLTLTSPELTKLPSSPNQSRTTTRSKAKLSRLNQDQRARQQQTLTSPSNTLLSVNSLTKRNKNEKSASSPIANASPNSSSNYLPVQQANSLNTHINYTTNQIHNSWNKSGSISSPDSVNSSNCMTNSANSDLINLNNQAINQSEPSMFTELNSTISSRYENLPQVDLFYNHHSNSTMSSNNQQHHSAFTALNRTNQSSPKYFTNNCESFVFNKPSQYSSTIANQLHSGHSPINQHSLNNQTILSQQTPNSSSLGEQHSSGNSSIQDNQTMLQMHQLSPLNNNSLDQSHLTNSHSSSLISTAQTSPVQLQHLQHNSQTAVNQQTNQHQLLALNNLNQIRNYACMPNSSLGNTLGTSTPTSANTILQQQSNANSSTFVNNIFLNAQNNSTIQPMSSYNDYPIMILE